MNVQREVDDLLAELWGATRLLPILSADRNPNERGRLVDALLRGQMPKLESRCRARPVDARLWRKLARARELAEHTAARDLYLPRLEEMELDLALFGSLGNPKSVRPIARRRYGCGASTVPAEWFPLGKGIGPVSLATLAKRILESVAPSEEPRTVPAEAPREERSLSSIVRRVARLVGLEVTTKIDPRLVANAAAGGQTVFIAPRWFGEREALRIAVHEVFGHVVAGANGRRQPLRILELGTARSFEDQEGVALWWEEQTGLMDGSRMRTLAARVVATDGMHAGASFGEVARDLMHRHHFSADESIALSERAFRGGGVARDVGYLHGWLRVRAALSRSSASIEELQLGKVSVDDRAVLRRLLASGDCKPARYAGDAATIEAVFSPAPLQQVAAQAH